jgi:hypothetical protein
MRTHLLQAALVATAALLPLRAEAAPASAALVTNPTPSYVVVDQLLRYRDYRSLDDRQVTALIELSSRLRQARAPLRVAGLDRVPSKSAPRFVRVAPSRDQAVHSALALLTSKQRLEATRLLHLSDRGEDHK